MNQLYICLTGGGRILAAEMTDTLKEIKNIKVHTQFTNPLCIFVNCPESKKVTWQKISKKLFISELGCKNVDFLDIKKNDDQSISKKLNVCDAIFFTGGDPVEFLQNLRDKSLEVKLKKVIHNQVKFIIGTSAGTLILSERCLVTPDEQYEDFLLIKGLGIFNSFITDVHYGKNRSSIIKEAITRFDINIPIYALTDNASIIWDGKIKKFGVIEIFCND